MGTSLTTIVMTKEQANLVAGGYHPILPNPNATFPCGFAKTNEGALVCLEKERNKKVKSVTLYQRESDYYYHGNKSNTTVYCWIPNPE